MTQKEYDLPERPLEPKEDNLTYCPVCSEEANCLYKDYFGNIVGCNCCIEEIEV